MGFEREIVDLWKRESEREGTKREIEESMKLLSVLDSWMKPIRAGGCLSFDILQ